MSTCPNGTRLALVDQVPSSPVTDRILDALHHSSARYALDRPDVLQVVAGVLAELWTRLSGRATDLRGERSGQYRREQLRGLHPLTLLDLTQLALDVPEAVVPALQVLARAMGYTLAPLSPAATDVLEAAAEMAEAAGAVQAEAARAMRGDGRVDARELADLEERLRSAQAGLERLRAAAVANHRGGAR